MGPGLARKKIIGKLSQDSPIIYILVVIFWGGIPGVFCMYLIMYIIINTSVTSK